MWWDRLIRLYLAPGTVLIEDPAGVRDWTMRADASLESLLQRARDELPPRARVQVYLSPRYCSPVELHLPEGLRGMGERLTIARATSAAQLNVPVDRISVDFDVRRPTVAAAIDVAVLDEIKLHIASQRRQLVSIVPLWSWVCGLSACRQARTVRLQEPGSVTVIGYRSESSNMLRAASLALPTGLSASTLANRLQQSLSVESARSVSLEFRAPREGSNSLPTTAWRDCWSSDAAA